MTTSNKDLSEWFADAAPASNAQFVFQSFDYENYLLLKESFDSLSGKEKYTYKGLDNFLTKNGVVLSSLNVNYKRLLDEISEQMKKDDTLELFKIDILDASAETIDLLMSLEEEAHIKDTYKINKLMVKGDGLNTSDASRVIDCIRQGRGLLQAGLKADILVKPLIHFYAATAYAYAIIVMNSPIHKSLNSLKRSHGHTYNHTTKTMDFGGDMPVGTFLDLLCAISVISIKQNREPNISFKYSALDSLELVQRNNIRLSLLALLSMVPELNGIYNKLDSEHHNVFPLNIDTTVNNNSINYNFYIGDGMINPSEENLDKCFKTDNIKNNQGSLEVVVNQDKIHAICPLIYQDLYGRLWYIESPISGLYLPEICLHFLIISGLSNIMRYSPHEWSAILTNRTSSMFSLIVSQYIRLFERKFPLLVTQYLSNYNPIICK